MLLMLVLPSQCMESIKKETSYEHIQWVGNWLSVENQNWLSNSIVMQARIEGTNSELSMNEYCQCSSNNSPWNEPIITNCNSTLH